MKTTHYSDLGLPRGRIAAGINTPDAAWQHYVHYGAAESLQGNPGRAPAPWFDAVWYLAQYPDLAAAGLSPPDLFIHFIHWGVNEGRIPKAGYHITQGDMLATAPDHILTLQPDFLVGTDAPDTYHAPLVFLDGAHTGTLQLGDRIDAGAGADTLTADLAGGLVAPHLAGIEHLQLSAYYPTTVLAAHIQGLANLTITQSLAPLSIQQLPTLVDLTLSNLVSAQDASGQPNHITLHYQPQALDGRATQAITLDQAWLKPGGTQLLFDTYGAAQINVLDISIIGASSLAGIAGAPGAGFGGPASGVLDGLHTVLVAAQAAVDLGQLAAPRLQYLDASASQAGVTVDLSLVASASLAIRGGAGDDVFVINAQAPQVVHLSSGGGHDTLVLGGLAINISDAPVVLRGTHTVASVDAALALRQPTGDPTLVFWQDGAQVYLGLDANGGVDDGGAGITLLATLDDLSIAGVSAGLTLVY